MKAAVDLHIHSALSPCGDNDMTPNNIVNMAALKGLDIISITDHNSALNLPAAMEVASKMGILILPGLEVQTREEVHMLCYLKNVEDALSLGEIIYGLLPDIANREDIFGPELVMDRFDNVSYKVSKLLLSSADISVEELVRIVSGMGGVCVPAHIDRESYSIISNLGFIPSDCKLKTIEVSKNTKPDIIIKSIPYLESFKIISSSDAHYLGDIFERESFFEVEHMTISDMIDCLKGF